MRKSLSIVLIILFVPISLIYGQNSKVMSAKNYLGYFQQEGRVINLQKARESINEAAKNENTSQMGKTWFVRGQVYYEIATDTAYAIDTMKNDPLIVSKRSFIKAIDIGDKKFKAGEEDQAYLFLDNVGMTMFDGAYKDYQNKDFKEAYKKFMGSREIIEFLETRGKKSLNPNKVNAINNAGLSAYNAGMFEEEMETYKTRLESGEENPLLYKVMAERYMEKDSIDKAKEIIAEGLSKFPDNVDLMIEDLNFYLREGKIEEAIDKLEKTAGLDPDNAEIWFVLGTAHDNTGDYESAEEAYSKALEADPSHYKSVFNLGALYFNRAVKINDEMNELGYKQQEKYEELLTERNDLFGKAKPYFEKAMELNPDETSIERELKRINSALSSGNK